MSGMGPSNSPPPQSPPSSQDVPSRRPLDHATAPPVSLARRSYRFVFEQLGPLVGLLLVFGLFSVLRPKTFLTLDNIQIILVETAVVGTAALGATAVIISGGIDLSVGPNIALCTVVIAKLLQRNYSPAEAALGGIAAAMVVGLFIGFFVGGVGLRPFIVTLSLWGAVRGLAKWLADETNVIPPNDTWLGGILSMLSPERAWMIFPPGVWIMLGLTLLVAAVFRYTRFGRHIFAIGSSESTARLCGVPVRQSKVNIYLLATLLAGIAGVMEFSRLNIGDPTTADGLELNVIAAVVIGGTSLTGGSGSASGTLIGALIMTAVANGCTKVDVSNPVQEMITGGIILLAEILDLIRNRGSV
jgi:ribose/xylose/arabinose/galactoside ABC-type transport system permease subunit